MVSTTGATGVWGAEPLAVVAVDVVLAVPAETWVGEADIWDEPEFTERLAASVLTERACSINSVHGQSRLLMHDSKTQPTA
ncbi:MAG: hypothetical protein R6U00_10025 [Prochlorococcaceae cyanobacterium]